MSMYEALVITPVKDSLNTTIETIQSIHQSEGNFLYCIYNDFSKEETTLKLKQIQDQYNFELINLADHTNTPSPNYRIVLRMAQNKALELNIPLIIIESDVEVESNTFQELIRYSKELAKPGMVAAITIDREGKVNFPYLRFKSSRKDITKTRHSLSFCCTLLTIDLLKQYNFKELSTEKHWYDVSISRKSIHLGLNNYLVNSLQVLHKPHSSRPWKQLKYQNPIKYYFKKLIKGLDRI
ncbi:MAG: glycosyltransferase family 2 protein [Verrucomicrobia bacterium]|nr:glycosyltransferase family 2 protein [Prolixibacteraceae bacterium]